MAKVLITGGTGLVGSHLAKRLQDKGYDVAMLSRTMRTGLDVPVYLWDYPHQVIDHEAIDSVDFIIHLAGTNIGEKRWTKGRKRDIVESRVKSGALLFNTLVEHKLTIKAFVSASAIGYYGALTSDKIFVEKDDPCDDFLGNTCRLWEQSADRFQDIGARTVKIRTGIVLTEEGGALSKMTMPMKFGMATVLGSGRQYLPWIHIDDLCDIYIRAIEDSEMEGPYNAVAPEHITYEGFVALLSGFFQKPMLKIRIPSFLLRIILGEMSTLLTYGSRVSSGKLIQAGYRFKFPSMNLAMANLLTPKKDL